MSSSDASVTQGATTRPPASPLLLTKFYLPPARPDLVLRPRLVAEITAGVQGALTLITAPAGFGKTSVFGAWRSSPAGQRYRVAWLSLDPDDDTPARFLQYVAGALDTAVPGTFEQVAVHFRLTQSPSVKAMLATILNSLAALTPSGAFANLDPLVLALDDYHALADPEVHRVVEYLLEHLPPCLHLVILSRADPPLRLARLKAGGQLTEIRASDLRFTAEEATRFLNEVMCLELPSTDIAVLYARTEGWVAGLKLAALRLLQPGLRPEEAARFVQTFETNHRFAAEFLTEEVVSRQPPAVQEFFLRSSILERMCAPLCDELMLAVDGHGPNTPWPSEEVIEHLVHRNLFVVPLDEEGYWFRYHHLFRDLLRARLSKLGPAHALALHRAAAAWYESQGLLKEAVKHALLTQDWDYAAEIVERHGVATVARSQISTVREWCAAFPEEVMRRRPALCIVHAWGLILSYSDEFVSLIETRLAQAEQGVDAPGLPIVAHLAPGRPPLPLREWVLGNATQLRAARMLWPSYSGLDPHTLIRMARQSMELLREAGDGATDSVNYLNVAYAYMAMGNANAVEAALAEARQRTLEGRNYYGGVTAIYYQAHVAYCRGELDGVEAVCAAGRGVMQSAFGAGNLEQNLPAIRSLDVARGCAQFASGDLAGAHRALQHALELFGWAPWVEVTGYIALARVLSAQGDLQGMLDTLRRLERLGPHVLFCTRGLAILGQLQASPDDAHLLAAASTWASTIRIDLRSSVPMGMGPTQSVVAYHTYLAWANVMVILGEARAALTFVEPALSLAVEQRLITRVIELSLVQALAHSVLGESRRSMEALDRALAAAEPAGHVRTFDQGEKLKSLLAETAARGLRRGQIRSILDAIGWPAAELGDAAGKPRSGSEMAVSQAQRPAAEFVEPLSEREQEVLELIAAGLSNAEIAARLYIGIGTVKTHVNHLFGKLDASSRTQLLARARILRLLS
jgi:LuxR family transcriptional regulator, maltose regulon positive regulatory protein